jgi:hypothetical protein
MRWLAPKMQSYCQLTLPMVDPAALGRTVRCFGKNLLHNPLTAFL